MATTIDGTVRTIGAALRENLTSVTKEPLPTEFIELLRRLEQTEAAQVSETQRGGKKRA